MSSHDSYVLARDLSGALRLDSQHLLFKLHNGYSMSPKIPISPGMKIAEIGTGTGIWLLDMASQLPETVQLDGFDISDKLFPHNSCLPKNVVLNILDAFGPVPGHLLGKYDVVHLRLWCCIIQKKDTQNLIAHAIKLLRPGGWLQWDEADLGRTVYKGEEAETFMRVAETIFHKLEFDFTWIKDLPHLIREKDMEVIETHAESPSPFIWSLITKTYLSGFIELFDSIYAAQVPGLPPRAEIEQKLMNLVEACQQKGSVYHWIPVSLLAQKAT